MFIRQPALTRGHLRVAYTFYSLQPVSLCKRHTHSTRVPIHDTDHVAYSNTQRTSTRDESLSANTILEPTSHHPETTEDQAARVIFHGTQRPSRKDMGRFPVRSSNAFLSSDEYGHRRQERPTLPSDAYFSPNSAPDIQFNELPANDEAETGSTNERFNFDDIYRDLANGKLDLPLHELGGKHVYELCHRALDRDDHAVVETLARAILSTQPVDASKIPALLLRAHIVHLQPTTIFELYKAFSPKSRVQYMSALFLHEGVYTDPTILTKLAELFSSTTEEPTDRIWPPFELLFRLVSCGLRNEALALLQKLATSGHVPPEALRAGSDVRDFTLLVYQTAVRSFLYWSMPRQAALFIVRILEYLGEDFALDPQTAELIPSVLDGMVSNGGVREAELAIDLFRKMAARPNAPRVPSITLQRLYEAAQHYNLYQEALELYGKTQAKKVKAQHLYPPPRAAALPWLLKYLARDMKDEYHSRLLVEQIVESNAPVIPATRAMVIQLAADHSFSRPARQLYERYASGRFEKLVTGSAGLIVRLCSLFASLARGERRRLAGLEAKLRERLGKRALSGRSTSSVDGHPDSSLQPFNSSDVADEYPDDEPEQTPAGRLPNVLTTSEGWHDADRLKLDIRWRRHRHDEFVTFARRVLGAYREAKSPIENASREDLNALARAHFVLGDIREGFDALTLITKRSQTPDSFDINVALGAVAADDPAIALRMLVLMARRGRKPDSVAVGTIAHHALRRGLVDVVETVLRAANKLNVPLDLKTVDGLVRGSIEFSRGDHDATLDNLRRALYILKENRALPYLSRATLGEICVRAALDAGHGVLAYEFWHDLLRRHTEWQDPVQGSIRVRIARAVEKQRKEYGEHRTLVMLRALRDPMQKRRRLPTSEADSVSDPAGLGGGGSRWP